MWAMKGNWSWPGEEECIHLAGSFLCIHLGSSRSASCSDQAFIRWQAAQTQLAQYGRDNRAPSPAMHPLAIGRTFFPRQCSKTEQEKGDSQCQTPYWPSSYGWVCPTAPPQPQLFHPPLQPRIRGHPVPFLYPGLSVWASLEHREMILRARDFGPVNCSAP